VSGRLDDEKLETLRSWGAGLGVDGRDELRAAGKAILILVEEIERLQVDVWHARRASPLEAEQVLLDSGEASAGAESTEFADSLDSTLRGRLSRLLGRSSVNGL
jgi:hypothetical protein